MSSKDDNNKDATVTVNVDDFTKSRDSVLLSLAQLQTAVSNLSQAYINHTSSILNREPANIDLSQLTTGIATTLQGHGLLGAGAGEVGDKRKRKRAPPDPNAPKRALTPFFLFMQHNRPKIANELGTGARPKEVADEGTKRWGNLAEGQKDVWRKLYADNLATYREKMKAYKAGQKVPDDDNVKAANQLQQDVAGAEGSGESSQSSESESESEKESEEEASPSPVKEPTPPRSKRRRSEGKTTTATAASAAATPSKKDEKKRGGARKEETASASAKKGGAGAGGEKKSSRKKRKSEADE